MKKALILLTSILMLTACNTTVTLKTTQGDITMELYDNKAPETVKNFLTLAQEGKYNGVPFHRVIEDFMIQTGDFENGDGTGGYSYKGPGTSIEDEFAKKLTHQYGAVSMANRGPNTGGSQFFIVQSKEGTPWLDGKHTIFGQVTAGMEIVDQIAAAEKDMFDRPVEDILIQEVQLDK